MMNLKVLSILIQGAKSQGGNMLRFYAIVVAILIIALGLFYYKSIEQENELLMEENELLKQAQESLYNSIQELEKRRELELQTLHELEQNKTKISKELDKIKDKIKANPSGNIVTDFNKALDEIFKDNNYSF